MTEQKQQVKETISQAVEQVQSPADAERVLDELEQVAADVTEAQAASGAEAAPVSAPAEPLLSLDLSVPERPAILSAPAESLGRGANARVVLSESDDEEETALLREDLDGPRVQAGETVAWNALPDAEWAEVFDDALFDQLTA